MSDVVLSTTEFVTTVTTVDDIVQVAVTTNPVTVTTQTAGVQGASYNQGDPIYVTVRNATGATLPKGTIVYISGSNGNHVQVTPALATSDATSARTLGWLAASIANNASGLCQIEGYLEGVNTQGFTSGAQLYLSGTTAGAFTATKPQAPIHLVYVGVVTKVSTGDGHVFVKVQNGYELDELHDVQITSVADGDVLEYDSATSLWKNRTLAQANIARLAGGNTFTGTQTVTGAGSGTTLANFNTLTGQNVLAIGDSGGFGAVNVTNGTFYTGLQSYFYGAGDYGASVNVQAKSASTQGIILRGRASQTGDLLQLQDSAANIYLRMSAFGGISTNLGGSYPGRLSVGSGATGTIGAVIRGVSGQTANLLEIQDSAAGILALISPTGTFRSAGLITAGSSTDVLGQLTSISTVASRIGLVVRGAASQTADLFLIQNNSLTTQFRVDPNGMTIANSLGVAGSPSGISYAYFTTPSASSVPVVVRGAASQSADLLQVQNSSGTNLLRIDSGGNLKASNVATLNSLAQLAQANSGGVMIMGRATAQFSSPGANSAALYFRDGTTAGTLKLVVRAGAAGAETTILDNIPQ